MRVPVAFAVIALFICIVLPSFPALAKDGAASMFLYDQTHGAGPAQPITVPLSLKWKYTVDQGGAPQARRMISSPAATKDSVYFFVENKMYALRSDTGTAQWKEPLEIQVPNPGDTIDSTPLVIGGTAIFGSRDGKLYGVKVGGDKGTVVSSFDLKAQHKKLRDLTKNMPEAQKPIYVQSSPLYHDGLVFVGGTDGWLYALDAGSLTKVWEFRTGGPIVSSPAYWNEGVYVSSLDGCVYGLSAATGQLIWRSSLMNLDLLSSPVVTRSKVIVAAGKYLYALDHGVEGYARWRFEAKGNIVGTPAVFGDTVVFGDSESKIYAISVKAEGNFAFDDAMPEYVRWQIPPEVLPGEEPPAPDGIIVDGLSQPVKSSPVIAFVAGTGDEKQPGTPAVIFRSGPRQLWAVSLEDGSTLWHYDLSELAGEAPEPQSTTGMGMRGSMTGGPGGLGGLDMGAGGMGGMGGAMGGGLGGLTGGMTGRTGQFQTSRHKKPKSPSLVFENEVAASAVAAADSVYVIGDDGALYAFSSIAADAVAPEFDKGGMEVPAAGSGSRAQLDVSSHDTSDAAAAATDKQKIPGALPIYLRIKAFDEGSGVDPKSISIIQEDGGGDVRWEAAYDAKENYAWAIAEAGGGKSGFSVLPEGDYVLAFVATDWRGNEGKTFVSFTIDNSATPPSAAPERGFRGRGMGGPGMMPGMGGDPGMMPGGMPGEMPGGMPGGMMPGGMPGEMPGGMMPGGMPGLPGMP